METLANGYTLHIYDGCFPLSTDSMVLGYFTKLPQNARVLDLGSGCGTLGLLLCAKDKGCHITGIELEENAHLCALDNIQRNKLSDRMTSIHGDLRNNSFPAGGFDCCVSNPPYFSGGPAAKLRDARREDQCSIPQLFSAAARSLKFGGDFYIVHRPERLAELCACGSAAGLEAKRLCLLRHKEGAPVALVLLQLRKGAKPGLLWEELCLHDCNGAPTEAYRHIYHL